MDIKKRIQELSLDQKAKLYYMALLQKGMIDRLPEDPKAAYVRDMMDKEDPKMDPAIRSDFDDPMFENLKETATELGYLNEDKQETIVSLDKLTFDMLRQVFSDDYKDVHFTRMQPDGKEGNYYRDAISFPNASDSRTVIGDMSALENWKEETKRRYGNVDISLKPEAENWFDQVEVGSNNITKLSNGDCEKGFQGNIQLDKEKITESKRNILLSKNLRKRLTKIYKNL